MARQFLNLLKGAGTTQRTNPVVKPVVQLTKRQRWRERRRLQQRLKRQQLGLVFPFKALTPAHETSERQLGFFTPNQFFDTPAAVKGSSESALSASPDRWKGMKSYLQIITTPTSDTHGTTLLFDIEGKRYIFGNLAESTQRACAEQGVRLLKVSEIFITGSVVWRNVGGLLGFILTLADGAASRAAASADAIKEKIFGKEKTMSQEKYEKLHKDYKSKLQEKSHLTLFGPANLNYMLATARRFIFRTSMPLTAHEIPDILATRQAESPGAANFIFQDDYIRVWGLSVPREEIMDPQQSPSTRSATGRKRSHDEIEANTGRTGAVRTRSNDSASRLAKRVVAEMFGSDWQADRLVEQMLGEVRLPAAIFVRDPISKQVKPFTGPMPGDQGYRPDTRVLVRSPWPATALMKRLEAPLPSNEAVSYIVKTHPRRGKFDPTKAISHGLNDKTKWSLLTQGQTIPNDRGEHITPDMVLGPSKPPTGFMVVDLPHVSHVVPFLRQYTELYEEIKQGIAVFVWILSARSADHPALKEFIQAQSTVKHITSIRKKARDRLSFESAAAMTLRLTSIDSPRYQVPRYTPSNGHLTCETFPTATAADRGQLCQMEPSVRFSTDDVPEPFDPDTILAEVPEKALQAAAAARVKIAEDADVLEAWASKIRQPDAEVITLGTGSAAPSKHRNVSATLVRIPGWGSILFDCGEGTRGQLQRFCKSRDDYRALMSDLRMIWVSHLHADHHLGTASVIKDWAVNETGLKPVGGWTSEERTPTRSLSPPTRSLSPRSLERKRRRSGSRSPTPPASVRGPRKTLAVLSDEAMLHWLWEYSQLENIGYAQIKPLCVSPTDPLNAMNTQMHPFEPPPLPPNSPRGSPNRADRVPRVDVLRDLGLEDLQAVRVSHCNGAMAVSITLPGGFKVSYSGDCRPSLYNFAKIGRDSDLLIHEATFDDELQADAKAKRHSTTGEALEVATRMRAKAVVLTHFSQRYAKVPVIVASSERAAEEQPDAAAAAADQEDEAMAAQGGMDAAAADQAAPQPNDDDETDAPASPGVTTAAFSVPRDSDMKVCMAFDYMRVKVGEIAQMERFVPALVALLESEAVQKGALKGRKAAEKAAAEQQQQQKSNGKGKGKGSEKAGDKVAEQQESNVDGNGKPGKGRNRKRGKNKAKAAERTNAEQADVEMGDASKEEDKKTD